MMPSAFISHGPPDRLLGNSEAKIFLQGFSALVSKPRAILIVSAHWITDGICLTESGDLACIHDFWGFPKTLNEMQYKCKQPEWLSTLISETLKSQGIDVRQEKRGLDHGAWSVLKLAYPESSIPVAALSLPGDMNLKEIFNLGQSLKNLRKEDVLIIGSGSATHNLRTLSAENNTPDWAYDFSSWLKRLVSENNYSAMCDPYVNSPLTQIAHPTIEHYAPLLIAAGAAVNEENQLIHDSFEYGSLNNSSWLFGNQKSL